MYGLVEAVSPRFRFGSFDAIRPGQLRRGWRLVELHVGAAVPVCSCCWIESWLTVSLTTTLSTYACRIGSVEACQAGLRVKVISLVGFHDVTWYGPSEISC